MTATDVANRRHTIKLCGEAMYWFVAWKFYVLKEHIMTLTNPPDGPHVSAHDYALIRGLGIGCSLMVAAKLAYTDPLFALVWVVIGSFHFIDLKRRREKAERMDAIYRSFIESNQCSHQDNKESN